MKPDRDLLVLLKNEFMSQQAIEEEVEQLNEILRTTEQPKVFCSAYELLHRNRITQKPKRLLQVSQEPVLKPFWFLIGKN
jgi:hypothetical protein